MATKSAWMKWPGSRKRVAVLAAVLLHGVQGEGRPVSEEEMAAVVAVAVHRALRNRRASTH